jgi:regulator of RNase E activity RraA
MLTGFNVPIRIGNATVMPGDIAFGDKTGVYFIPPQLVEEVLKRAADTKIHDDWTKAKFREGKYKSSDIYGRPHAPELIKEYEAYKKAEEQKSKQ